MLITNFVSSRIGAKKTLIWGLILIVIFAAAAGSSPSIGDIIAFRGGWGVGNALFIATSLAVIVASASGGMSGAIVLYETALGLGIAIGPLLGGTLGSISWRGPFYGVSALMAIALIATITLVEKLPKPPKKTSLAAPIKALKHRGLLTMSLTALCYNWGFFTVLGYAPFPLGPSPPGAAAAASHPGSPHRPAQPASTRSSVPGPRPARPHTSGPGPAVPPARTGPRSAHAPDPAHPQPAPPPCAASCPTGRRCRCSIKCQEPRPRDMAMDQG
jgi:MFS family permease